MTDIINTSLCVVKKHITPQGDGNFNGECMPRDKNVKKHITPQGDGNNSGLTVIQFVIVLRNTLPRKGTETDMPPILLRHQRQLRNTLPRKGTETILDSPLI